MNEVIKNMMERRSCRAYKEEQITQEQLEDILTAGKWAPTGMGMQSPVMVVVQNKEVINRLSKMNAQVMGNDSDPFYGAPTVIVVFANSERATYVEDGALVMGNLMNAAHSVGVDSCWIHRAREVFQTQEGRAFMKEWGVPDSCIGVGHCILGYAAKPIQTPKPRKEDYVIYVK